MKQRKVLLDIYLPILFYIFVVSINKPFPYCCFMPKNSKISIEDLAYTI